MGHHFLAFYLAQLVMRFDPQRLSGQAVVAGITPSSPSVRAFIFFFIAHRVLSIRFSFSFDLDRNCVLSISSARMIGDCTSQRPSGQAVVIDVVPPPPGYVRFIFLVVDTRDAHCRTVNDMITVIKVPYISYLWIGLYGNTLIVPVYKNPMLNAPRNAIEGRAGSFGAGRG